MPIYEFSCPDCGAEFEMKRSFSDTTAPICPNCQGTHVQRLLSRPAIHFKGSGWYITDSKNSSKTSANGKTTEEGTSSETKSTEGKSASEKPAESTASESKTTAAPATKSEAPAASKT